jgi:hypothetical protein
MSKPNFGKLDQEFYRGGWAQLGQPAKDAYTAIVLTVDYETQQTRHSTQEMGNLVGASKSTIKRGLTDLRKHNIIHVKRRYNKSSIITIMAPAVWIPVDGGGSELILGEALNDESEGVTQTPQKRERASLTPEKEPQRPPIQESSQESTIFAPTEKTAGAAESPNGLETATPGVRDDAVTQDILWTIESRRWVVQPTPTQVTELANIWDELGETDFMYIFTRALSTAENDPTHLVNYVRRSARKKLAELGEF